LIQLEWPSVLYGLTIVLARGGAAAEGQQAMSRKYESGKVTSEERRKRF